MQEPSPGHGTTENDGELNPLESRKEIRHLRNTITALRTSLDNCHADTARKVEEAVRDSLMEAEQLRESVRALRAEIDTLLLEKEQAV